MRLKYMLAFLICVSSLGIQKSFAGVDSVFAQEPYVVAMRGCTQEDGPAWEIYFTSAPYEGSGDPPQPYVRVEIASRPGEPLDSGVLDLMPLRRDAEQTTRISRAELIERNQKPVWLSGALTLDAAAAEPAALTGSYDFITSIGADHKRGQFSARVIAKQAVCG